MTGMLTEVGEFGDVFLQRIFYGKPLDRTNIADELGDILWYVSIACNALGISLSDVMEANIRKLQVRFPERYTDYHAAEENRNRAKEEQATKPIPKEITCKHCKGTGEVWTSDGEGGSAPSTCGMCRGVGQVPNPCIAIEPKRTTGYVKTYEEKCSNCKGCGFTHGTGKITVCNENYHGGLEGEK